MSLPVSSGAIPTRRRLMLAGFGVLLVYLAADNAPDTLLSPARQVLAARSWTATPCQVLTSRVVSRLERLPFSKRSSRDTFSSERVTYRYTVNDVNYVGHRYQFDTTYTWIGGHHDETVARLAPGLQTTCFVNPVDASEAVMERGFTRDILYGGGSSVLYFVAALCCVAWAVTGRAPRFAGGPSVHRVSTAPTSGGGRHGKGPSS